MTTDRDEPEAPADRDARAVALGKQALDDARAEDTRPPDETDPLAVEEVRAARARRLGREPWTDPDPQPGDFDAYLDGIDPRCVEALPGNPDAKITRVTDKTAADRP